MSILTSSQTVLYDLFKRMLGSGPVYAALGNHDTYNEFASPSFGFPAQFLTLNRAQDAPHSLGGNLAQEFSWSAFASPVDINHIYSFFIGTMTTFPGYGNMRTGSHSLRLLRHAHTTRHTVCSVLTGCVSLLSILTYVSVSLLGCIELN